MAFIHLSQSSSSSSDQNSESDSDYSPPGHSNFVLPPLRSPSKRKSLFVSPVSPPKKLMKFVLAEDNGVPTTNTYLNPNSDKGFKLWTSPTLCPNSGGQIANAVLSFLGFSKSNFEPHATRLDTKFGNTSCHILDYCVRSDKFIVHIEMESSPGCAKSLAKFARYHSYLNASRENRLLISVLMCPYVSGYDDCIFVYKIQRDHVNPTFSAPTSHMYASPCTPIKNPNTNYYEYVSLHSPQQIASLKDLILHEQHAEIIIQTSKVPFYDSEKQIRPDCDLLFILDFLHRPAVFFHHFEAKYGSEYPMNPGPVELFHYGNYLWSAFVYLCEQNNCSEKIKEMKTIHDWYLVKKSKKMYKRLAKMDKHLANTICSTLVLSKMLSECGPEHETKAATHFISTIQDDWKESFLMDAVKLIMDGHHIFIDKVSAFFQQKNEAKISPAKLL